MTVAALPIGGPQLGCAPASRGFSPAAEKLCGLLEEALSARTSMTLGGRYYALAEAAGGAMEKDWDGGPGRAFTITIHGNGELKYATLFGRDRDYGSAQFVEEIPEQVAYHLGRFLDRSA